MKEIKLINLKHLSRLIHIKTSDSELKQNFA